VGDVKAGGKKYGVSNGNFNDDLMLLAGLCGEKDHQRNHQYG
jgi:hypothetical protein